MSNIDEILKDRHYPKIVSASAGTGKTELVARIVEDLVINEGVDIDSIGAITFTNKAADEMKERFRKKIYASWLAGNRDMRWQLDRMNTAKVCTIHKFCELILREFAFEISLTPTFAISSITLEKDRIINRILEQNYDETIFETLPAYSLAKIIREFDETTSDKGIIVELARCEEKTFWDKLRNYMAKVFPLYVRQLEEEKFKKGKITVNDIIKYKVKILGNKKLEKYIRSWLTYLFIDEAQDINHDQKRLIEMLIDLGVKVFIVGDHKQAIYGFRGSDRTAFIALHDKVQAMGGKMYTLTTNYRSNKHIVEKVNSLFDREFSFKSHREFPLKFENQPLEPSATADAGENTIKMEYGESIRTLVKRYHAKGTKTAILARTNREAIAVFAELKDADISVDLYVSKSLYKTSPIIGFCKVLNFMIGGGELERHELFYTDFFLAANAFKVSEKEFFEEIKKAADTLRIGGISEALSYLAANLQITCYYEIIKDQQALANVEKLLEIVRNLQTDGMTSMEIIRYLNLMIATKQEESQPRMHNDNSIIVSTIHMYKGLDADTIIVTGIDSNLVKTHFADFHYADGVISFNQEELLPNNSSVPPDELFEQAKNEIIISNLEEELRVMYVMMTRPRNKLILSSNKTLEHFEYMLKTTPQHASYLRWLLNK